MKVTTTVMKLFSMAIFCVTLSGCVATIDGVTKKINEGVNAVASTAKNLASSTNAEAYRDFAAAEMAMVRKLADHQNAFKLQTWFFQRDIHVRSLADKQVFNVPLAASFRVEINPDAVAAKDDSAAAAIDVMSQYIALRSTQEPSRLVIVAQSPSQAAWMKSIAQDALKKAGRSLEINVEYSRQIAIGWMSEGPQTRSI